MAEEHVQNAAEKKKKSLCWHKTKTGRIEGKRKSQRNLEKNDRHRDYRSG